MARRPAARPSFAALRPASGGSRRRSLGPGRRLLTSRLRAAPRAPGAEDGRNGKVRTQAGGAGGEGGTAVPRDAVAVNASAAGAPWQLLPCWLAFFCLSHQKVDGVCEERDLVQIVATS